MSAMPLTLAPNSPNDRRSLLYISGDMGPGGFEAILREQHCEISPKNFEYLLEIVAAWYERDDHWLFNQHSYSCGRNDDCAIVNGLAMDLMAHNRVRHLRKLFDTDVETGHKAYRLHSSLSRPIVSKGVLSIPYLNVDVVKRLRLALECHRLDTF